MNAIERLWLHFLRLWHIVDLTAALQVDNWEVATDCRLRIAELERQLDNRRILK